MIILLTDQHCAAQILTLEQAKELFNSRSKFTWDHDSYIGSGYVFELPSSTQLNPDYLLFPKQDKP